MSNHQRSTGLWLVSRIGILALVISNHSHIKYSHDYISYLETVAPHRSAFDYYIQQNSKACERKDFAATANWMRCVEFELSKMKELHVAFFKPE